MHPTDRAGTSQAHAAARERARAAALARERQLAADRARRHDTASRAESAVAATLAGLVPYGWRLLADRCWPGSTTANVDLVLVGPGGVLVVDVKAWAEPRIEGERLYRGQADETGHLDAFAGCASLAADALAELGLAPSTSVAAVVLAGRTLAPRRVRSAIVVGEHDVVTWAVGRGTRLGSSGVSRATAMVEQVFPPWRPPDSSAFPPTTVVPEPSAGAAARADPTPPPGPPTLPLTMTSPPLPRVAETAELFDVDELAAAEVERAALRPVEEWMTWLHPEQRPLVTRRWNGPARLSGPAGTGKTVVALHRVARAARRPGARVLVTTLVRTLPTAFASWLARLTPEHAPAVEVASLHRWATQLLRERGRPLRLDPDQADRSFARAWLEVGKRGPLAELAVIPPYFQEEIAVVIKGRGVTSFDHYATLDRVGRRTALRAEHRAAVWDLYCAYDALMRAAEAHDYADVLALALDEVAHCPPERPYTCVVADEVQDLTLTAVRLLHSLVGDREDGLLLVGDGAQALYPGGFRLAEAGVAVAGRSVRLSTNYRNSAAVLEAAATLGATAVALDADDVPASAPTRAHAPAPALLPAGPPASARASPPAAANGGRPRGSVTWLLAGSPAERDRAVLDAVTAHVAATGPAGCAVLVRTNAEVAAWRLRLDQVGITTTDLREYAGTPLPTVVVGTLHRAKGLEFGHVFLPDAQAEPPRRSAESDGSRAERAEPWRRGLLVGVTRARNTLWCGLVEERPAGSVPGTTTRVTTTRVTMT